jgi:hypothetical protein
MGSRIKTDLNKIIDRLHQRKEKFVTSQLRRQFHMPINVILNNKWRCYSGSLLAHTGYMLLGRFIRGYLTIYFWFSGILYSFLNSGWSLTNAFIIESRA